jgi:hypothetical protein
MPVHQGSCHCGAVQFDAEMELDGLATCNCSICGKTGAIMAFVPKERFHFTQGEDRLTDYQFGKKRIHHTFCPVCGVRPAGRGVGEGGAEWAMVNVRCLDGVDVHALTISKQYDGKSW